MQWLFDVPSSTVKTFYGQVWQQKDYNLLFVSLISLFSFFLIVRCNFLPFLLPFLQSFSLLPLFPYIEDCWQPLRNSHHYPGTPLPQRRTMIQPSYGISTASGRGSNLSPEANFTALLMGHCFSIRAVWIPMSIYMFNNCSHILMTEVGDSARPRLFIWSTYTAVPISIIVSTFRMQNSSSHQ